jgi:glycosyltransferase involved in cell wall biosynthesis
VETLSHTALSVLHAVTTRRRFDASIVFNAANAPLLPLLRLRGLPVAVHVDGLEWKRTKWGGTGRRYYRLAERLSVRTADALIADAQGIADYYDTTFGVPTELLTYGAPILEDPATDLLAPLGLEAGGYHLVVARFEPENHVREIVQGYAGSEARLPLVVVGSAPYADEYTESVKAVADQDQRIRMIGGLWDQDQLNQLYAHAVTYLHGHSVGGTNPSLLRAMGAGSAVIAYDVNFNREVLGGVGGFFRRPSELARLIERAEAEPDRIRAEAAAVQARAGSVYRWDDVAAGYARLLSRIADGESIHHRRRTPAAASAGPHRVGVTWRS